MPDGREIIIQAATAMPIAAIPPTIAIASPCDRAGLPGTGLGSGAAGAGWRTVRIVDWVGSVLMSIGACAARFVIVAVPTTVASVAAGTSRPSIAALIASANSRAVWKRSSGRFASARFMTPSNGFGTWTFKRRRRQRILLQHLVHDGRRRAGERRSPVSNSYRITPAEKRSERPSTVWPMNCSGDM